ncbi:hypothetical protein PT974_03288 [Cladobotryum mycophilum]|uniref:Uncharacterized protein n=1 Tax=Cladobotryum mycophilum TaxID=491253 RepID=A0ABR0SRV6_9HYPO
MKEDKMERIRADLIRRAKLERHGNDDGNVLPTVEPRPIHMEEAMVDGAARPQRQSIFSRIIFPRKSEIPPFDHQEQQVGFESPKPSHGTSEWGSESSLYSSDVPRGHLPRSPPPPMPHMGIPHIPEAAAVAESRINPEPEARPPAPSSATETSHLRVMGALQTETTQSSNSHRKKSHKSHKKKHRGKKKNPPSNFMFCFPWVKSRRMRAYILQCFVSGLFLVTLLAVYLGLAVTKNIVGSELNVMMILITILASVWFCFAVMRICILAFGGDQAKSSSLAGSTDSNGYIVPSKPIRVVLAQDEEAAGEATKINPPAYGLWQESVRVDPNRLFWQRNQVADSMPQPRTSGPRPPSYISEDGLSYAVDASPRSMWTPNLPQELHPSEVGRVGQPPPH